MATDAGKSLDHWRRLLAEREARLVRLEKVKAPEVLLAKEHELIERARRAVARLERAKMN